MANITIKKTNIQIKIGKILKDSQKDIIINDYAS